MSPRQCLYFNVGSWSCFSLSIYDNFFKDIISLVVEEHTLSSEKLRHPWNNQMQTASVTTMQQQSLTCQVTADIRSTIHDAFNQHNQSNWKHISQIFTYIHDSTQSSTICSFQIFIQDYWHMPHQKTHYLTQSIHEGCQQLKIKIWDLCKMPWWLREYCVNHISPVGSVLYSRWVGVSHSKSGHMKLMNTDFKWFLCLNGMIFCVRFHRATDAYFYDWCRIYGLEFNKNRWRN